jgi:hypothetical protein
MQLTLTRILEINAAAKMLLSKPIKSSNLSWRIGRIHRLTETERQDFLKEQNRLISQVYGAQVEGTEDFRVKPENESAYQADVMQLLDEELELDLPHLKLEMFEAQQDVEPKFFDLMDNLITE